ncbi:hypothetical protein GCM10027155_11990 [Acinetobacter apis]|uniref:Uncharacterized protein n=1 Tax=Acinetobacter apis TaxID=1229165 RepID=A0A217EFL3_9GAMM|nr:hypothetical protein [Acinetobacter apis]SNQ29278.1 hypothetical protein SAMN05444584_1225 [Acinetobacter apis]
MQKALITLKAKDNSHTLYFEKVEEFLSDKDKQPAYSLWVNRDSSEIVDPDLYFLFNSARHKDSITVNYIEYNVTEVSQLIKRY